MITKKIIAEKLLAYLQDQLSLAELVAWAEQTLFDADYADDSSHTIRNIVAQLAAADVKAFRLEWRDCERIMTSLGFKLEVKAMEVA